MTHNYIGKPFSRPQLGPGPAAGPTRWCSQRSANQLEIIDQRVCKLSAVCVRLHLSTTGQTFVCVTQPK